MNHILDPSDIFEIMSFERKRGGYRNNAGDGTKNALFLPVWNY